MEELSGPAWVARFPGSHDPAACVEPFRSRLIAFLAALHAANATVHISATFRPPERAFLMHHAFKIARNLEDPREVPAMAGVEIDWVHRDESGDFDPPKSRSAASRMVSGFEIVAQPALVSRHTQGRAIDMDIMWNGSLTIARQGGGAVSIASGPRTGMNPELQEIGASYGVVKAVFAGDPPHWSIDGH